MFFLFNKVNSKIRHKWYRYYDIPELEPTYLDTCLFVLFIASLFIALILVIIYGYLWNIGWCKRLVQKSSIIENFILDYRGYFNARPFTTLLHGFIIHPGCLFLISKFALQRKISYNWLKAWGDAKHFFSFKIFWNQDSYDETPEGQLILCCFLYIYMLYFIRIHYSKKELSENQILGRFILLFFFSVGMIIVIPYIPDFIFIGDPIVTKLYAMKAIQQEIQVAVLDTRLSAFLHGQLYYVCLVLFNVFKIKCFFYPAATFRNFKNNFKRYRARKKANPDLKMNYRDLFAGMV